MAGVQQMFLLIIFQGFYLGSVGQRWTFPPTVTALIGSCVEIPCTYHPVKISDTSGTVWYLYSQLSYLEVLNTKDSSAVLVNYKDRTSLVPGENSCTLRIDPVRGEDNDEYYFPGNPEDKEINSYEKHQIHVHLHVTDSPGNMYMFDPHTIREGEATPISCYVYHTCRSSPPSIQWNKPGEIKKRSAQLYGASWREESELTYIPSYVDDGSRVQCTASYPNGQRTERSRTLDINYAPKNVTVTIIRIDKVIEESDVTLQCNSNSKPVVYEYEWYKGKTRLPDRGREMTVYNVPGDMEPYSCTAINRVGRGESAPAEIPVLHDGGSRLSVIESNNNIILLATIGAVCPLLVVVLVYIFWRKFCRKEPNHQVDESSDAAYTDLVRNNVANDYDNIKYMKYNPRHDPEAQTCVQDRVWSWCLVTDKQ
ncbi:B-cell receptor CD22-like [Leptodactylus fuscus]|uniref:B-cell receptor CD22-like n=1 Tax=Leptodactylus fuscus TaxID=238119 RepID=UPI003F4ECA2E